LSGIAYNITVRRTVTKRSWKEASQLADAFVAQLNLTEKVAMVTGNTAGPCDGNINAIPRLNFDGLCIHDGPAGVRVADLATLFPPGVTVGATWDKKLMYARGLAMGQEFRGKGAHAILGYVARPQATASSYVLTRTKTCWWPYRATSSWWS
jgi:beta-glucosidase